MKRALSIILSALIVTAALASCAPAQQEDSETVLPTKLDMRNLNGKNYVTPVKSQLFGDCWAHSLAGSAEIAYLYANDMGVDAGEINDKVNFSEKYIVSYFFHGITEDDVKTGRVRASQVGEGFDPSEAEETFADSAYIIGGPCVQRANFFGSGFGPVDESVELNGEKPYAYNADGEVGWKLPQTAEYRCAATDAMLRNSRRLPTPAARDEDGNHILDEDALRRIKLEIYKGHGVSLAVRSSHGGFSMTRGTAYYEGDESPDHAMVVVGYDDSYSKDNFTRKKADGAVIEGSTPPGDGAFIIKNSWGLVSRDDSLDDGYIYLSYYDNSITAPQSFEFDKVSEAKHKTYNIDQYDLMITEWYGSTQYDGDARMANVYDAEEDGSLYQIAFVTAAPDVQVSYEIYKDVSESGPSSGTLLEQGETVCDYQGYHKLDLKSEYELKKGERYSVVLTMKPDGGEGKCTEIFPYSTEFFDGMTVRGIVNSGESFILSDGAWKDMSELRDSLIDRAFTQCSEDYADDIDELKIKLDKSLFTIDNYPIKAIIAPANAE